MEALWKAITEHQLIVGAALVWLGSSAAQALPAPSEGDTKFYRWLYAFAHIAGANWKQVFNKPQ